MSARVQGVSFYVQRRKGIYVISGTDDSWCRPATWCEVRMWRLLRKGAKR